MGEKLVPSSNVPKPGQGVKVTAHLGGKVANKVVLPACRRDGSRFGVSKWYRVTRPVPSSQDLAEARGSVLVGLRP